MAKKTDNGVELTRAFNWYSYYSESNDVKWVLEYLKKGYNKRDIASFKKLSDKEIPQTVRVMSRMLNNGSSFDDDVYNRFLDKVRGLIEKGKAIKEETKVDTPTKSPQEYLNEKIDETIAEIENVIDSQDGDFSLYNHLQKTGAKSIYGKKVAEYYTPILAEINEALNKSDKELTEGYVKSFGGVRGLKKHQKFLQSIVDDAERFALNQKKTRVRKRKAKAKSAIDLVKKVNYKKEDKDLKLVSTNPANMIGASSLWTFNTKTRMLTVYNASDGGQLTVSGSTLKNFDEDKSESKKVRVTYLDTILPKVLNGGKIALRKLLGDINAKGTTPNGRLNKDTILLRAIK